MSLSARVVRSALRTFVRHFPVTRGKHRIVETLVPLYASAGEDICTLPGGASIRVDPREHVQRFIYFFGAYERESVEWFIKALKPGMTVLDIGANVGQYSLVAASQVGKTGRVHGFEPNPVTYRRLADNIALNRYSQVTAHSLALSDQAGSATLYLPKDDNLGEASLQKYDGETESTVITTLTADEWMESADLGNPARIDLIKIDVQGYETRAIRGASKLLARYRPLVICEFEERWLRMAGSSCEELKHLFNSLGYTANKLVAGKLVPVAASEAHGFENLILVPRAA